MQQTLHKQPQRENTEKYVYLKLPFINEELKRRALSIVRRTGLENIRLYFDNIMDHLYLKYLLHVKRS